MKGIRPSVEIRGQTDAHHFFHELGFLKNGVRRLSPVFPGFREDQ